MVRHGGGGDRTDLVCGYLHSEDPLFDPAMRVFPSAFVVRLPPTGPRPGWVQASVAYALEENAASDARTRALVRRAYRSSCSSRSSGCTWRPRPRSTRDGSPRCAIRCSRPRSRCCTARPIADGRSPSWRPRSRSRARLLDERFRQVLGRSPIRYLTEWRMHLAEELLATTDIGVATLARRVGYDSDESFSRRVQTGARALAEPLARRTLGSWRSLHLKSDRTSPPLGAAHTWIDGAAMSKGVKRAIGGIAITFGTGYVVKKTRKVVEGRLSPFATALLVAVVGVVASQVIGETVNRIVEGVSGGDQTVAG